MGLTGNVLPDGQKREGIDVTPEVVAAYQAKAVRKTLAMNPARIYLFAAVALAIAGATAGMAFMQPTAPRLTGNPVVVELFTSQSCSSCPPAEDLFKGYAKRPDLISLEWHVDYWNSLNVGEAGRWKDPYSKPEWTARQQVYNQRIRGKSGVYTPQAVIAGASEAVGSHAETIALHIKNAASDATLRVSVSSAEGELTASAKGAPTSAEFFVVTFRDAAETAVKGGENQGRMLNSAHLVTGFEPIAAGIRFPFPAPGEGCAVIVQAENQGPILGGAYCPAKG